MKIDVLLFASLRDRAGAPTVAIELPEAATVESLREAMSASYPELAPGLSASRVAVDNEFRENSFVIPTGCEVAVIPPVSGG